MAESDDTDTPPTCGTCRFFHPGDIDPSTLQRNSTCRESLHVIAIPIGMTPQGPGVQTRVIYAPVPGNFPACGRYVAVEEWQRQGDGA